MKLDGEKKERRIFTFNKKDMEEAFKHYIVKMTDHRFSDKEKIKFRMNGREVAGIAIEMIVDSHEPLGDDFGEENKKSFKEASN